MAEKPLEGLVHEEGIDLVIELTKEIVRQHKKGKTLAFVDKEFLECLDKQVETGKFESRSHAIEVLILNEMRKE